MDDFLHNRSFLSLVCGAGAFVVIVLIWMAFVDNDPLAARMKNLANRKSELREVEKRKKMTRRAMPVDMGFIKRTVQNLKLEQGKKIDQLRLKLARAGYRSRDAMFIYLFLKLAAPLGGGFLAFFLIFVLHFFKMKPIFGLLAVIAGVLFGGALPDIIIKNTSQRREHILRKAMPDALDLMVICAEAGLSLDASFERVSREIGPSCAELAEEIGLTAVELSFLPDRAKALQNLSDRVPLPGVLALCNTLIQTEKYGTPLTQALRVLSSEMREDRIMAAEAKAAKLPATLTIPMILFILPPLFVVLIGPAALKVSTMMHH